MVRLEFLRSGWLTDLLHKVLRIIELIIINRTIAYLRLDLRSVSIKSEVILTLCTSTLIGFTLIGGFVVTCKYSLSFIL